MTEISVTPAYSPRSIRRLRHALILIALFVALGDLAQAQTYTCFPTCSTTDARFLSLADASFNTLSNNLIVLKLGSPGVATAVDVGIFDGETSGRWDVGTTPLSYILYADPDGDGLGNSVVASWSGAIMPDNAWYNAVVNNVGSARAPNGNYLYALHIRSTDSTQRYWSNFKIRSSGSVLLKTQLFSISASMAVDADQQIVYPAFPALTPTTYDGSWDFYIDVPFALSELVIWDGDMDHGNFDCSDLDDNDPDTPQQLPPFATPNARPEGVASGNPCVNGAGLPTGGMGTGTPPDDNVYVQYRRSPAVNYSVIHPNGTLYLNDNPSGNLEWERFRLAIAPMNPTTMDYHADSLPVGIYNVHVEGMDLANLNAWRFSQDLIGVDETGEPVPPLRPHEIKGVVCAIDNSGDGESAGGKGKGKGKKDGSTSNAAANDCNPISNVRVVLNADLNGDGLLDVNRSTTTDGSGRYMFDNLVAGTYTVYVVTSTLPSGATPVDDFDGVTTPNRANATLVSNRPDPANVFFTYGFQGTPTNNGGGVRTQGYWKNHPNAWPVSSISIGCTTYTKAQAIAIMKTSVAGDKTYSMFVQLVAAKLNVASGATSSCIVSTISAADTWLCNNPLGSNVGASSSAWQTGGPMHEDLDSYNNGQMCAAHLD